jgi:hypothetical protein
VLTDEGQLLLRCSDGDLPFVESAIDTGIDGRIGPDDVAVALDDANSLGIDAPLGGKRASDVELAILAEAPADDPTTLVVGIGDWAADFEAGRRPRAATLTLEDGSWKPSGWGDCDLEPALPADRDWLHVAGPVSGVSAQSTSVSVQVYPDGCRPESAPLVYAPEIVRTGDTLTIYLVSKVWRPHHDGDYFCEGDRGLDSIKVDLGAPLGDRSVYDGSVWPPLLLGTA